MTSYNVYILIFTYICQFKMYRNISIASYIEGGFVAVYCLSFTEYGVVMDLLASISH